MSDSDDFENKCSQRQYADIFKYLTFLSETKRNVWRELYDAQDQLTFPERLVLIHPRWYSRNKKATTCEVRGRRRRVVKLTGREPCESIKFWKYQCPFDDPDIKIDHVFPWSLGGPSINSNSAYLCAHHNLLKGPDIHHLELNEENYNFGWFPETLEKVRKKLA